jgi:ubiquinone/menaquinone biosynthesis C-methylase UbiE
MLKEERAPDARLVERVARLGVSEGRALDVGSGSGHAAIALARRLPGLEVVGVEASAIAVAQARRAAAAAGLADRVRFLVGDPKRLPFRSCAFDLVTCDATLRRLSAALPALNEMSRVLRDDGALIVRDLCRRRGLGALLRGLAVPPSRRVASASSVRGQWTEAELTDLLRRSTLRRARLVRVGRAQVAIVREAAVAEHRPRGEAGATP